MAAQSHPYWQHQFLHTAGLPTGDRNVTFLSEWNRTDKTAACDYNPLQMSQSEPGSTRCHQLPNGKWARNYQDTQSAANAFADQLNLTDYPALRRALATGDPFHYKDRQGVEDDLREWGVPLFARYYQGLEIDSGSPPSPAQPLKSKNVAGAWSRLMRTLAVDGHATIRELRRATENLNRIERRLRRA